MISNKIHKWARAAHEKSQGVKGRKIPFTDDDYRFFVTLLKKGRKVRRLIFRVHSGREYLDRFNWWFVFEKHSHPWLDDKFRVVGVEAAKDADIKRWLDTHHWTCLQKGFPGPLRWRRYLKADTMESQRKDASEIRWEMNFKTLNVRRVKK